METFQTISEISATFVGLAGIVIAVSTKNVDRNKDNTLLGIFSAALSALFFSLFPELILGGFPEDQSDWRLVCGVFGIFHLVVSSPTVLFPDRRTKEEAILLLFSQPTIWLKIAVGAGFLLEYSYQIYLFGLVWMLGVSMFYFVRYVLRMSSQFEGDA